MSRVNRRRRWQALALAVLFTAVACGGGGTPSVSGTSFKGTKKIGYSGALSGGAALYGKAVSQALLMAVDETNAKGGVNGYKLELDVQDDATTVDKAVANTKQMILQDNVVAMLGPVTSAQCAAASPISKQNKVIYLAATCNIYQLTTEPDLINPYYFSFVPNTFMEGIAAGVDAGKRGVKNIFIVSPKYNFGVSETNAFLVGLKKTNPSAKIVNAESTWYVPFPTNPNWGPTINQIQAAKPDMVYSNIFAADQINFITQALQVDPQFFQKYPMMTLSSLDELRALGAKYPLGMRLYMRAPYFAIGASPSLNDFVKRYQARWNELPSDWAVMDTDAFNTWVTAATAAKSFDGDKVRAQMAGKSFNSLRGPTITLRIGDQQANVGETIGTTADSAGQFPFPTLKDIVALKGDETILPVQLMNELRDGKCEKTAGDPTTTDFVACPSYVK